MEHAFWIQLQSWHTRPINAAKVGRYLGYTERNRGLIGAAAPDPEQTSRCFGFYTDFDILGALKLR
jgi:hypothetical protein